MKRSEVGAENLFVKRIVIEIKTCDVGGDRFVTAAHSLKPGAIVATQRFAHRESNQTGTVALLRFPLIAELVELSLSNRRKPAAEIVAVLKRAQFRHIRNAVVVGVNQRRFRRRPAGSCHLPIAYYLLLFRGGHAFRVNGKVAGAAPRSTEAPCKCG